MQTFKQHYTVYCVEQLGITGNHKIYKMGWKGVEGGRFHLPPSHSTCNIVYVLCDKHNPLIIIGMPNFIPYYFRKMF